MDAWLESMPLNVLTPGLLLMLVFLFLYRGLQRGDIIVKHVFDIIVQDRDYWRNVALASEEALREERQMRKELQESSKVTVQLLEGILGEAKRS